MEIKMDNVERRVIRAEKKLLNYEGRKALKATILKCLSYSYIEPLQVLIELENLGLLWY